METKTSIDLINGTFNSKEGRDLILNLLNHKIHFHMVQSLSYWERTGKKDPESLNRLEELKSSRDTITKLMDNHTSLSKSLIIHSTIEIQIVQ